MSILKIARMGHPVLGSPADLVRDPESDMIRRLVADMIDTMADAGGVGLAAPQVYAPVRLVIFHVPSARDADERYEDAGLAGEDDEAPLTVLINPAFEPQGEDTLGAWEGCLSLPGMTGFVPRYRSIRYWGIGLSGEKIERRVTGFHARVVQHELDHLNGMLFPMRMTDLGRLGFSEEMRRYHIDAED